MITAIKIALVWIPASILLFIVHYGGDTRLQPWQAIVSIGPALLLVIIDLWSLKGKSQ